MADNGSSGVNAMAIVTMLVILVLAGVGIWWLVGQNQGQDKEIDVQLDTGGNSYYIEERVEAAA